MKHLVRGAVRAVGWGSVAGGGPFLLLTVPISIAVMFDQTAWRLEALPFIPLLAVFPLVVAAAIVVPAFVVIGLPVTWLFRRLHIQPDERLGLIGALTGILVPVAFGVLTDAEFVGMNFAIIPLGGLSGAVTGIVWAQALASAGDGGVGPEA